MDDKRDGRDPLDKGAEREGGDLDPGLALHMRLGGGGDPVEPDYSAQGGGAPAPRQRDEDIDSGVALHMRLGGAGEPVRSDDYPEPAGGEAAAQLVEGSRLCPGCNTITEFSEGVCSECGFRFRSGGQGAPPAFEAGAGLDAPAGSQILKIILVVAIIAVLGYGISRIDFSGAKRKQSDAGQLSGDPFIAVQINEDFHNSLSQTLMADGDAWQASGVDAYVYRYRVESRVEDGASQLITITGFVGGDDAASAAQSPGDKPLLNAMDSYLRSYRERQGLELHLQLVPAAEAGELLDDDRYVRWGYWYGREHQAEVDQVVNAIESYRSSEGQYPRTLGNVAANMKLENRGFGYVADGWGYLPIFETDGSGKVPFGTGSSSAELYPRRISGYYLVKFLGTPTLGGDLFGDEGKSYYLNRISPLPCIQKGPLTNVPIEPDGEPDGIAWAVKNGELLDV
ncbi:MAG: hypothetical protein R3F46_00015 [bacterium]